MPVYRLTNVGQHIARRILDPKYVVGQERIRVAGSNSVQLMLAAEFAVRTLASRLNLSDPFAAQFPSALNVFSKALDSGAIDPDTDSLDRGVFNQVLESGLFVEGTGLDDRLNPISSIKVINFQVSLNCNLSCLHCSRGNSSTEHEPITIEVLANALEQAYLDNVMQAFAVTGGEPTLYKGDLFWLFKFAAASGVLIQLVTNGWWGDKQDFIIWGQKFKNAREFTDKLRSIAPMGIHFSLDGTRAVHDHLRQAPGSFNSAIAAINAARESRLIINTNTVDHPNLDPFSDVKGLLAQDCGLDPAVTDMVLSKMRRLGRAAVNFPVTDPIAEEAYLSGCRGFYAPRDLTISYDGRVGTCGYCGGYGEFGDLKTQTMTQVLNGIQDAAAYRLHVGQNLRPHLHLLPEDIFPRRYSDACEIWIPLTIVVTKIDQEEKRLGRELLPQEIRAIQEYVSWRTMLSKSENPFG